MKSRRDPWFEHDDWLAEVQSLAHWKSEFVLLGKVRTSYLEDFKFYLVTLPEKSLNDLLKGPRGGSIIYEGKPPLVKAKSRDKFFVTPKIKHGLTRGGNLWRDKSERILLQFQYNGRPAKFRDESVWIRREILDSFLCETKQVPVLWFLSRRYSESTLDELGHEKGFEQSETLRRLLRTDGDDAEDFPRINA